MAGIFAELRVLRRHVNVVINGTEALQMTFAIVVAGD
jgi:hypothetical protein